MTKPYRHQFSRLLIIALVTSLSIAALFFTTRSVAAQSVDWTTVDRAAGGTGWNDPPTHGGTGAPGPASQSFSNLGGTGVTMTVSYSGNMWDNRSTPNIYGAAAPFAAVKNSLRWTNNRADNGGTPGAATGPAQLTIEFSQPIFLRDFTVATLSQLLNHERYEWIEVQAFDPNGAPVVATELAPGTYDSSNNFLLRPNSPFVLTDGNGLYRVRGTSIQGTCPDLCGYDRLTFNYATAPIQRIKLTHYTTTGPTFDSPRTTQQTSVAIEGFTLELPVDYGDLPENAGYATTLLNDGARHQLSPNLFLGATVDYEADGQPNPTALGDDNSPVAGPDDEDGVSSADLSLQETFTATVRVRATNRTATPATLTGWIDFNGDGQLTADERAQAIVPAGTHNGETVLDFGVVPIHQITQSYARFRLSTDPAAGNPNGLATDGEVEDYAVTIRPAPTYDYGDAPAPYNGDGLPPSHLITTNLHLGTFIDSESAAQPTVNADGDDLTPNDAPDDEDGVTIADLALQEGVVAMVHVNATNQTGNNATLYGWIDFNGNGLFEEPEQAQVVVPSGSVASTLLLNFGATPVNGIANSYARFRLSTDPAAATPNQPAHDGEIEEYPVTIALAPEFDYGDAPASYSAGSNGPSHLITDTLFLGATIDAEEAAQPSAAADGDDRNPSGAPDDEDGVPVADLALATGQPARIRINATNRQTTPAQLYGWIDFNGNGLFDGAERAQVEVPPGSEGVEFVLDFGSVPLNSVAQSYARFRLSTDTTTTNPTQAAANGEVEDYVVTVAPQPPVSDPQPHFRTRFSGGSPTTLLRPQLTKTGLSITAPKLDAFPSSADDRNPDAIFSFEEALDPALATVIDASNDGRNQQWGPAVGPPAGQAFRGQQALWVAAGGSDALDPGTNAMPPNLATWFSLARPLNLVDTKQADIEFRLDLESEPVADAIFVGVSTDNVTYKGVRWSGNTGGWEYFDLDLREYLGYPEVYVAWAFVSDGANADGKAHGGAWLDQVAVWTYLDTGPATERNDPVRNGGFETNDLADWIVAPQSNIQVVQTTSQVDGDYVVALGGVNNAADQLSQPVSVPADRDVLAALRFWFNIFGEETTQGNDRFCARLYGDNGGALDQGNQILDLGCLDGVEATTPTFNPDAWRLVEWQFSAEAWESIAGQTVHVLFELVTNDALPTTVYVDGVSISIVTDGTPGDALEPNDFTRVAVTATTDITMPNLTIDPAFDVDVFAIFANAGETIVVNVDAVRAGSPLDAAARLLTPDDQLLCQNDDDQYDSDPYLTCVAPTTGIYHAEVSSFSNQGSRDQRYTLTIQVLAPNAPPPENPAPPPTPEAPPATKTWTAMIYMDGDTDLCGDYQFFKLIERLENNLGDRIGPNGFINVVVLFDRIAEGDKPCNSGGTTRYDIQPNAQYTVDVNIWQPGLDYNMGDPETLVHFVTWAMRNYPAEHYYLAIEDHGNGIAGIAWDYTSRDRIGRLDQLTNRELHSALKTITQNGARKLDILAYEACLMGTYENAFDVRNFANYLFFFPTVSYTNNASYPAYLGSPKLTPTATGREFGEIIFGVYQGAVTVQPYVMTLVDTAAIDTLHGAVNAWAEALIAALPTQRDALTLARQFAQKVDSTTRGDEFQPQLTDEDYYLDLWDLADLLEARGVAPNESRAVKAAVEAVVLQTTYHSRGTLDYSRTHGLTIYWPKTASGYYRGYVQDEIYSSTTEGRWDEFLQAYFGDAVGGLATNDGPVRRERATEAAVLYLPIIAR